MPVVPAAAGPAPFAPTTGPCAWDLSTVCCSTWDDYDPATQLAASEYASTVLWAATGRQFGLCEVTVRPCGRYTHGGVPSLFGFSYSVYGPGGPGWYPYIGEDGLWRNCACAGTCGCRPDCEIYLPAPVASIVEVIVDDVVIPSTSYRVDDNKWLVRTDGGCWPDRADLNVDSGPGFFQVSYVRGTPVPAALLGAAGVLACEFAKACAGDNNCRLPVTVQSIARQGVTAIFTDYQALLDRGLTGLPEVDQVIVALNPFALKARLRVWSPEIRRPRMTTYP